MLSSSSRGAQPPADREKSVLVLKTAECHSWCGAGETSASSADVWALTRTSDQVLAAGVDQIYYRAAH
jgi:hypothetical protein